MKFSTDQHAESPSSDLPGVETKDKDILRVDMKLEGARCAAGKLCRAVRLTRRKGSRAAVVAEQTIDCIRTLD